jgi:hypothetical protein
MRATNRPRRSELRVTAELFERDVILDPGWSEPGDTEFDISRYSKVALAGSKRVCRYRVAHVNTARRAWPSLSDWCDREGYVEAWSDAWTQGQECAAVLAVRCRRVVLRGLHRSRSSSTWPAHFASPRSEANTSPAPSAKHPCPPPGTWTGQAEESPSPACSRYSGEKLTARSHGVAVRDLRRVSGAVSFSSLVPRRVFWCWTRTRFRRQPCRASAISKRQPGS